MAQYSLCPKPHPQSLQTKECGHQISGRFFVIGVLLNYRARPPKTIMCAIDFPLMPFSRSSQVYISACAPLSDHGAWHTAHSTFSVYSGRIIKDILSLGISAVSFRSSPPWLNSSCAYGMWIRVSLWYPADLGANVHCSALVFPWLHYLISVALVLIAN